MSSATDLESGQGAQAAPRAGVGGSNSALPVHEAQPVVPQIETLDETTSSACGCIPGGVFRPFTSMPGGSHIDHSQRNVSDQSTQIGQGSGQEDTQTPVASNPTFDPGPRNTTSDSKSEEPRMIGDFDGSASEFWKLFTGEAKSHDDARIGTLKEGMDSALIFAGLFSAALTAFVVDSKQNLKPSPADETVYYLRQHSTILSQISVQLSSIAPQVAIPPTPPPPFPQFSPLASDVRVNVFWFMALAFSLLAALLAILVQQWVRKYMAVFQRYGDPLKSSRVRQYLYEGCEKWYMPRVAEAVPGFLHISLFLFFAGLGDSLLCINTKVALSNIVPIGVSGLLYIFTTFAPLIYPQSPYQNSFSGIFWYLFQKLRGRRFRDRRSDGQMKPVSTNMAEGQVQLSMEETEARRDRDVRAIRWLIGNLTEDAEMEKFLPAIPGSFNTDWGTDVWKRVGKCHNSEDQSRDEIVARPHRNTAAHRPLSSWNICTVVRPIVHLIRKLAPCHHATHATTPLPVPHPLNVHRYSTTMDIQGEDVVHELSTRVARSLEICKNRGLFANKDDLWRRRTRACIEATASLLFCANAKRAWFGGISKPLGDIGSLEKIRELSLAGLDELFVIRWTCLSLVAIRPILEHNDDVLDSARWTITSFAEGDETGNNDALVTAQKINEALKKASDRLSWLCNALWKTEDLTEDVKEILRDHESEISELEQINVEAGRLEPIDRWIYVLQKVINHKSHQIISQFPGVFDDFDLDDEAPLPFSRIVQLSHDPRRLQFICPRRTIKSMCSPALTLRNILEGKGDANAYKEMLKNLKEFPFPSWHRDEMQLQLWRLQDLCDGDGLGFTVDLFFLALSRLLATSSSKESNSALYTGTFQAIISDWNKHKNSLGTQKLLLGIASREDFAIRYPAYIVDEFLLLLGNIFEGQTGPHNDETRQQFESFRLYGSMRFREGMLRVLMSGQTQSLAP